jgi:hypothetical protein
MLPLSQHYRGVEGRVGVLRWDYEEVTSFTHSHKPTKTNTKQLMHSWSTFGRPEIPTTRISATLRAHNVLCRPLIAMRSQAKL